MQRLLLYEINTRVWIHSLRQKYDSNVNLASIPDEELSWIANRFNWVWLMGIWEHTQLDSQFLKRHPGLQKEIENSLPDWTEEDLVGSPYAINKYEVNPKLGSNEDLQVLKRKFNELGVKVMVDFVPNHFGIQTPLAVTNPDYFIHLDQNPAVEESNMFRQTVTDEGTKWIVHGKDPYFPPWDDTFQVNILNRNLRQFLIDTLLEMSSLADGVRCDMAMLVNNKIFEKTWGRRLSDYSSPETEFWSEAIMRVKNQRNDFVFLAEVYWDMEEKLQTLGFDYVYDKGFYDKLMQGDITWLKNRLADISFLDLHRCLFIENHDEVRIASKIPKHQNIAAAALIMTLPALCMLHMGQLEGRRRKIPVQIIRQEEEDLETEIKSNYEKLLRFVNHTLPINGVWKYLHSKSENIDKSGPIFTWYWESPKSISIIVINYSNSREETFIDVKRVFENIKTSQVSFVDFWDGKTYTKDRVDLQENGLFVKLESYGIHLFHYSEN